MGLANEAGETAWIDRIVHLIKNNGLHAVLLQRICCFALVLDPDQIMTHRSGVAIEHFGNGSRRAGEEHLRSRRRTRHGGARLFHRFVLGRQLQAKMKCTAVVIGGLVPDRAVHQARQFAAKRQT